MGSEMCIRDRLDTFYAEFSQLLEKAEEPEPAGMQPNQPTMTDIACTTCGRPMQVRTASTGVFLGCSGYPKCKNTSDVPAKLLEELGLNGNANGDGNGKASPSSKVTEEINDDLTVE